jgi:hypothetical protein
MSLALELETEEVKVQLAEEQEDNILGKKKYYQNNGYDYTKNMVEYIEKTKEEAIKDSVQRGIHSDHATKFIQEGKHMDFMIENIVDKMVKEGIISEANGYDQSQIDKIKNPGDKARRRTEA